MAEAADKTQRRAGPWAVVLVLVGLAGLLIAAYLLMAKRDMAKLFEGLRPTEASAIVEELDAQAIPYELADGGATILTPADQRDATRLKLAGAELPLSGQEGLELFDTSDIGLTEFAQRIKYQRALQGELTRTIMKMDGVLEARIHISIPERSTFRSERSPAKAAVTLLTRSPDIETPETIAGIQQLVAASIVDLAPTDVVVLNGRGAVISPSTATAKPAPPVTDDEKLLAAVAGALPVDAAPAVLRTTAPNPSTGPATMQVVRVRVTTSRALTEVERTAAIAAIKTSSVTGMADAEVGFEEKPMPTVASVGNPAAVPAITSRPLAESMMAPAQMLDLGPVIVAVIATGFLAAAIFIAIWRRSAHRLSVDDQRRFAERLRIGLRSQNAEAIDGAS